MIFCSSGRLASENQSKRKGRQVLRPYQRTMKVIEHVSNGDSSCNLCAGYDPQRLRKETGRIRNQRTNYIQTTALLRSDMTENSPWDLRGIGSHSHSEERPSDGTGMKNLQGIIIMIHTEYTAKT